MMDEKQPKKENALIIWFNGLKIYKGDRAELRRSHNPQDALLTPSFHSFRKQVKLEGIEKLNQKNQFMCCALVATILSHVNEHDVKLGEFSKQLAKPKEGKNKSPVSELRFRQLQKSHSIDEFHCRMIRIICLLEHRVNILSMTIDIVCWYKEFIFGPGRIPERRLSIRWAINYYSNIVE